MEDGVKTSSKTSLELGGIQSFIILHNPLFELKPYAIIGLLKGDYHLALLKGGGGWDQFTIQCSVLGTTILLNQPLLNPLSLNLKTLLWKAPIYEN